MLLVSVALICLGSASAGARLALQQAGPLMVLADAGGEARMEAVVVTDARATEVGIWQVVRVSSVAGLRSGRRALIRPGEALPLGARVAFDATARPLEDEPFDRYLRGLHVAVAVTPVGLIETVRGPPGVIAATNTIRSRVRAAAGAALLGDHAALLSGLVTGDTTGLSTSTSDTMRAAGLSHLVAVSGSNVALVVVSVAGVGVLLRLGARGRRRLVLIALVWFCVLVRGEPSVLRATFMAMLVLTGAALGRGHDSRAVLGVAALLLLMIDPLLAGQLGFALSVLATGGVLVVGPAIARRVPGPRRVATLVGATVGAQFAVAPVLFVSDGGVSLAAVPANLIAVPAAAIASAVGVAAAVIAQVSIPAGAVIAALARPATGVILLAGQTFADLPTPSPLTLVLVLALLLSIAVPVVRRRHPALALPAAVVVVAIAVVAPWGGPPTVTQLTLVALDVGQGDAVLIEVPGASGAAPARMLVDAGPDQTEALALLRKRGIQRLDVVVATHPHADHTNGLPAVLARMHVGTLVVGALPPERLDEPSASAAATHALASQRNVATVPVAAGQQFALGRAHVEVLSPPSDGSLGREPNENSVVLRVTDGDDSILLTGDAEVAAQQRLLRRPDLLRADVLKVPHHGGNTNAEGFIEAVGADTAVIGVGADNDYGHPHADVLADLGGATILRTDLEGEVSVAAD